MPKQLWVKAAGKQKPQSSGELSLKFVYTSSISNNIKNLKTFPDADVLGFNFDDFSNPKDTEEYLEK